MTGGWYTSGSARGGAGGGGGGGSGVGFDTIMTGIIALFLQP